MSIFTGKNQDDELKFQRHDQTNDDPLSPEHERTVIEIDGEKFVPDESRLVDENGTIYNEKNHRMTFDSLRNVVPKGTQIAKSWTHQLIYPNNEYGYCEDLFALHEDEPRLVLFNYDGGKSQLSGRIMCSQCAKYNLKLMRRNRWGCAYQTY